MPVFRGFTLGLRHGDVRMAFDAQGIPATLESLPPPLAIILGLSRKGLLERRGIPALRVVLWRFCLLTVWAITAIAFFATVASFLLTVGGDLRGVLVATTVALGIVSLLATAWYFGRVAEPSPEHSDVPGLEVFPWDILIVPEAGFIALAAAMVLLLVMFMLVTVWLPLLFLALNVLTVGELWRRYRIVFVEAPDDRADRLPRVGGELLRKGGVLSRDWDAYLSPGDIREAQIKRRGQIRFERWLFLLGLGSLLLAGLLFARRALPPELGDPAILAAAGFTVLIFFVLLASLLRGRRASRMSG